MINKMLLLTSVLCGLCFYSCTSSDRKKAEGTLKDTLTCSNIIGKQNSVSIAEIPATDLSRAIRFYQSILSVKIEEAEMGSVKMGVFPADAGTVNVVLASGADYKPSTSGCVLYLNGGEDLQVVLNKVEPSGGKILVPKTEISPEMGFFALFLDTEGNKLGLHSRR